ncbi:MAG: hypothetical protein WBG48_05455, partial [Pricia sp.]
MKNKIYILGIVLILPILIHAQGYNTEISASIDLEVRDHSLLQITGLAENKTAIEKSLRYELSVIKSDKNKGEKGNSSKTGQEGRFVLPASDKKELSTSTINIDAQDRTIILLLIYDEEDNLLGKDRKVLNGIEGEVDGTYIPRKNTQATAEPDIKEAGDDGFILRGMVIEDTKTKAGNDFYDFYYGRYLAKKIEGDDIVSIAEKLAIGGNTQIEVKVGDDVIMQ